MRYFNSKHNVLLVALFIAAGCNKSGATLKQSPITIPPDDHIAPANSLVDGFPTQLILDSSAKVASSAYLSTEKDYVAILTTSKSLDEIFTMYLHYFDLNGYSVLKQTRYPNYAFLLAQGQTTSVSIEVTAQPSRTTTFKVSAFAKK